MIDFLREFIRISSETKDVVGVFNAQKLLFDTLKSLGAEVIWIEPELPGYAPALLAQWKPANNSIEGRGVCLVGHTDTVYPAEDLIPFSKTITGDNFIGGGVADNKGGVVIACEAIRKLFASNLFMNSTRPLYFFSSSCEELGSPAFQKFIKNFSQKLEFVLGLEPALPNGDLIKKRRGNRYYTIRVQGNAVHTGRDVPDAANPIDGLVMAHALVEKLKKNYRSLSASLNGIKSHPFKFNMSSDTIEATLDVRFENAKDILDFHKELEAGISDIYFLSPNGKHRGTASIEMVDDCPAFDSGQNLSASSLKLAEIYSKHESQVVNLSNGLGSSDCCYFYRPNLNIVDGLGPRGGKIHSKDEFIESKSLEDRTNALAEYLSWLLAQ